MNTQKTLYEMFTEIADSNYELGVRQGLIDAMSIAMKCHSVDEVFEKINCELNLRKKDEQATSR